MASDAAAPPTAPPPADAAPPRRRRRAAAAARCRPPPRRSRPRQPPCRSPGTPGLDHARRPDGHGAARACRRRPADSRRLPRRRSARDAGAAARSRRPGPGPAPVAPAARAPAPVRSGRSAARVAAAPPPARRCRRRSGCRRRRAGSAPAAELAIAEAPIANGDVIAALEQVLFTGASDLHVTANSMPMLRVDGRLRPVPGAAMWNQDEVMAAVRGLMTEEQQETFDKNHELDFAYALPGGTRFRVNCYQQRGATGAAFRIISTTIRSLEELGVPDVVAQFATLPRGLVLVTGPTGSGKSTTLAALIDLVNRTRYDHIVTVEDPIEYVHANKRSLINQREVGSDTHSFSAALKHVLRQDPDVILVGEMRDLETISVALTAAETGHLVFATLHTQDAAQTIDRIIDVYPSHQQDQIRTQLAATLHGRRRRRPWCRAPRAPAG